MIYAREVMRSEVGQGMQEYAVVLAILVVTCIGSVMLLGESLQGYYNGINQELVISFESSHWF